MKILAYLPVLWGGWNQRIPVIRVMIARKCVIPCWKAFADQKNCYEYKEVEVQAFRDTYNRLAIGGRLTAVEPAELEAFLEFGTELFQNAITGFERGWKQGCTVDNYRGVDKCQMDEYYLQRGYSRRAVADALSWIARNNWVAELLLDYDKDFVITDALLNAFIKPTIPKKYSAAGNKNGIAAITQLPDNGYCQTFFMQPTQDSDGKWLLKSGFTEKNLVFVSPCMEKGLTYPLLASYYNNDNTIDENDHSIDLGEKYCQNEGHDKCSEMTVSELWHTGTAYDSYKKICTLLKDNMKLDEAASLNCTTGDECEWCKAVHPVIEGMSSDCGPQNNPHQPCSS